MLLGAREMAVEVALAVLAAAEALLDVLAAAVVEALAGCDAVVAAGAAAEELAADELPAGALAVDELPAGALAVDELPAEALEVVLGASAGAAAPPQALRAMAVVDAPAPSATSRRKARRARTERLVPGMVSSSLPDEQRHPHVSGAAPRLTARPGKRCEAIGRDGEDTTPGRARVL